MPQKRRESDKHETAARKRRVPLDELMAFSETARRSEKLLPAGMEALWVQWSPTMKDVDARTMLLLRAAFQAGYEARR